MPIDDNVNVTPITTIVLHEPEDFNFLVDSANAYLRTISEWIYEEKTSFITHLATAFELVGIHLEKSIFFEGMQDFLTNYLDNEEGPVRIKMTFQTENRPVSVILDIDADVATGMETKYRATFAAMGYTIASNAAMGFDAPVGILN